jgi:two-component system OmpR family response regulator
MEKLKILVIEDERDIRLGLEALLEDFYEVNLADGGLSGIKAAIRSRPDLILLDLNMPDLDGFQTCKALRSENDFKDIPIVILTAYDDVDERIKAFEFGADDYISKPFDTNELLTRIKRKMVTSRGHFAADSTQKFTSSAGNIKLDTRTQEALMDSKSIGLSALEFKLLHYFISNSNKLLSRKDIIENVWEKQEVSERIIDPHILSLRSKIEGSNYVISSVYRGGYILKTLN